MIACCRAREQAGSCKSVPESSLNCHSSFCSSSFFPRASWKTCASEARQVEQKAQTRLEMRTLLILDDEVNILCDPRMRASMLPTLMFVASICLHLSFPSRVVSISTDIRFHAVNKLFSARWRKLVFAQKKQPEDQMSHSFSMNTYASRYPLYLSIDWINSRNTAQLSIISLNCPLVVVKNSFKKSVGYHMDIQIAEENNFLSRSEPR